MESREQLAKIRSEYNDQSELNARSGAGLYEAHLDAYQRLLVKYQNSPLVDLVHADFLIAIRQTMEAEQLLHNTVNREAEQEIQAQIWEKLGMIQMARGAEQTALASLENSLTLSDTYRVRRMICLSLYSLGRIPEAVNQLYLTLSLYQRIDRELLMLLADCHVKASEFEDAIMVYHQALMDDRHNLKAYEMLQQLRWKIKPGRRTDLAELPPGLPDQYITLQSFEMENNRHWPHWQEVIDQLELPVVLLACDREYRNSVTFSRGLSNRTLLRVMISSSLHLTENLFSQHYAEVLETPTVIVGSQRSGAIFNTETIRYLGQEELTTGQLLNAVGEVAPFGLLRQEEA